MANTGLISRRLKRVRKERKDAVEKKGFRLRKIALFAEERARVKRAGLREGQCRTGLLEKGESVRITNELHSEEQHTSNYRVQLNLCFSIKNGPAHATREANGFSFSGSWRRERCRSEGNANGRR